MDGKQWVGRACVLGALVGLGGCGQHDPLPFPDYTPARHTADQHGPNAYDDYVSAANSLDAALGHKGPILLTRTSYSVGQRPALEEAAAQSLALVLEAGKKPCTVPHDSADDLGADKYRLEWRLLGRCLSWRMDDALQAGQIDAAIDAATATTKFGFDLTSGGPEDASLGFAIVDDARRKIAPSLGKMTALQLSRLSREMKSVYLTRPPISDCLGYAGQDMLESVQKIQDAYRTERYEWITKTLGADAKEPVQLLRNLHQQPDSKRAAFFEGFAADADAQGRLLLEDARQPAARRKDAAPKAAAERPWKRLSRFFFGLGRPLLAMNDATCARTQLLILEAEVLRSVKASGQTPPDLSAFTKSLTVDPFTGEQFVYRTDGKDYKLYSVGSDLTDNDGETDESFTRPDLTLEHAAF